MSLREVRLLLVDDDPSAIQVMSRMLAHYPNQQFATSGSVALRLARETQPDLIVLDIEMPDMSGLEVCDALRADPALTQVPVIFVTKHATPTLEAAALTGGAVDFVTKPLNAAQLTARVRAHLRTDKAFKELKDQRLAVGATQRPIMVQSPRLLIVDDDVTAIQMLQQTLTSIGEMHFASSGAEALRLARSLQPHLILLDAHMPELDGYQVCAMLKAEPAFEHTPIVFVTRFSEPRNEMRALDLGAADFIAKPYTPAVLLARVRNLLDLQRRAAAELQSVREHWRNIGDARVAAIVAGASDAIVSVDANEEVMLANAAAGRLFGRDCAQMIGMPLQELLAEDLDLSMPSTEPLRVMVKRGIQGAIPVETSISRAGEGSDASTTLMLRDVSDRERLASETRARSDAETASRTKPLMMSYIAHEIGNPLNGILGMAGIMARDTDNPLGPKQAKRLANLLTCSRSLEVLMRDVLDVGRFEAGKLNVHLLAIDATRCVAKAIAAVSVMATQARVTLSPPQASAPVHALADGARLQQCLANLLTNAIKYNRTGGWVRVDVQGGPAEVAITVHDNGLGMDAAQLEQLFEPFNRVGRQHTATLGMGLGLMITRQLVGAMNGRLLVESAPGVGSCFSIFLPGSPEPYTAAPP